MDRAAQDPSQASEVVMTSAAEVLLRTNRVLITVALMFPVAARLEVLRMRVGEPSSTPNSR
jgi:hypothetical protein